MGPLAGVTILDLTQLLSGPFGTMTLCDLGAEVIKLERPTQGELGRNAEPLIQGHSAFFFNLNRGKQSIAVDLTTEAGRSIFLALAEHVDVVTENFLPGTMDRLGLGWNVLSEHNPQLIYAALSGFGQDGPDSGRPTLDIVVQAESGLMSVTGEPHGPPMRAGISLADIGAGLYLAIGILAALYERDRSGRGQMIDVGMLDCQIALMGDIFTRYFATHEVPGPLGSGHAMASPFQAFLAKDGYLVLALNAGAENQWALFCAAIDRVDLIDDPRFESNTSRVRHRSELESIVCGALRRRNVEAWLGEFRALGIPCGAVNTIPEAAEHPQALTRRTFVDVSHPELGTLRMPDTPIHLSRTPGGIRGPSPGLGEDTASVLSQLAGLDDETIFALRHEAVIQ
jgi:crotonobetainyl-CoA:carnitine CoA-transferase CaiB-like acyl-CoA transferase